MKKKLKFILEKKLPNKNLEKKKTKLKTNFGNKIMKKIEKNYFEKNLKTKNFEN